MELSEKIYASLKSAFSELIEKNKNEEFYTFGIFTDDSLQFIHAVANTEEALTKTVLYYNETVDPEYNCTTTRSGMRWSYGDWGFFPEVSPEHFNEINEVLRANFDAPEEVFDVQIELLWSEVLNGFKKLDENRFFGAGEKRSKITLLLVGDLPEELIDKSVKLLNPPEVVDRYLNWDTEARDSEEK